MAKPFDATTKDLLESDPVAWLTYLGLDPQGAVEMIDSDLSTVTAEADKVFRVVGPESHLVHVEMQSSADTQLCPAGSCGIMSSWTIATRCGCGASPFCSGPRPRPRP